MAVIWHPEASDAQLAGYRLPPPGTPLTPAAAKELALLAGLKGLGRVAPNPLVGSVIVDREHRFLGAGGHEQIGQNHAEINALEALEAAGVSPEGGTLYVTLEPCAHANRTPACAPRVAKSGLARVVYGLRDPNPAVDGRGAALLKEAGIQAELDGAWSRRCARLAEIFLWNMPHRTPFVGLKVAATMDGVMARVGDKRQWITGPRARAYGHFLRLYYDAIAVGQRTLLADNPTLDARDALISGRAPKRVVLDPDGAGLERRSLSTVNLLRHAPEGVLWLTGERLSERAGERAEGLAQRGARHLRLPVDDQGLFNPEAVLAALAGEGVTSLLLEGGAGLYGAFLARRLVNRLHLFQAARLFGGADVLRYTDGVGAGELTAEPDSDIEISPLGDDWVVDVRFMRRDAS